MLFTRFFTLNMERGVLMKYLPTGQQMRDADLFTINHIGITSMVLMERAALKVVESMENEQCDFTKVLVLCGSGNNGGDGYAVARLLHLKGHSVDICFVGNENSRSEENQNQKRITDYYQISTVTNIEEKEYSVIIDAIFGTGLKRNIEGHYHDIIMKANHKNAKKVAIDIPSGIHDSTGEIMGIAFKADITVAIAFVKRGLILHPGTQYTGKICEADIGITADLLGKPEALTVGYDKEDLSKNYPKRRSNSHKGSYGKVLIIAGSKGMSGAAYLSAKAAYTVGAGLVQIYTTADNRIILQQLLPEAIVKTYDTYDETELRELLLWADVVGIGCGLGKSETSVHIVRQTLKEAKCPCVVDADALNILAENESWMNHLNQDVIMTPHMKEMSRLLHCSVSELNENRFEYLEHFVSKYGVTCALKDARTLVQKKGEFIYLNLSGNAAMAKGGSGDVLTGIIAGIVGQKTDCYSAACLGVYLHGLAGDYAKEKKGSFSVLASDIIEGICGVLREKDMLF